MGICIDVHTHSIASGHGTTATLADMARAAAARQMTALCITDHGPATLGAATASYFMGLANVPRSRFGVRLLLGCEANICDFNGTLDLPDPILAALDFNIASLHPQNIQPGTVLQNTRAVIKAMENPHIRLIGHPDDEKYPLDPKAFVEAAKGTHTLVELNRASLAPDGYRGHARQRDAALLHWCAMYGQPVVFGSDSHGPEHVGDFAECMALVREVGFPEALILNDQVERILGFKNA